MRSLFSIHVGEVKNYARKNIHRSIFEQKRAEKDNYCTVTVYDKRRDINARPKVFNLRNPSLDFLVMLRKNAYDMLEMTEIPVILVIEDLALNEVVEKTIKLKKITMNLVEYTAEMTNPIDKQIDGLCNDIRIIKYSEDGGKTWKSTKFSEDDKE